MSRFILASLAAALLCACATFEPTVEQFEEQEFRTGSNLPRREHTPDNVSLHSKEMLDSFQRATGPIRGPDSTR